MHLEYILARFIEIVTRDSRLMTPMKFDSVFIVKFIVTNYTITT